MNTLTLKEEVQLLRSALIGIVGKDSEGNYRASFVREMFSDLKRTPEYSFSDSKTFLTTLEKTK